MDEGQSEDPQVVLDEIGADTGCAVPSGARELAVARPEAIYFYSPDGRGPCYVFEGWGTLFLSQS